MSCWLWEAPQGSLPRQPQPSDCGTERMGVPGSSAAAETKRASLPCEAQQPSDVMRNVTAWQTRPGEISESDHPSMQKRVAWTGPGQREGGLALHGARRWRPPLSTARAPWTRNHTAFMWIGIHTDTVPDMWLCGTAGNRKANGSTCFIFIALGRLVCILHTILYRSGAGMKPVAACG